MKILVHAPIVLLLIAASPAYSDSVIQSDWSGGPDVWGPVSAWGTEFFDSQMVTWNDFPGEMSMLRSNREYTVATEFDGARCVHSADIDGDGDMDIIGAASLANEIIWWENVDGSGESFSSNTIDDLITYACCVYCEDIDGDGDMDVIGGGLGAGEILWWENVESTGTSWTKHILNSHFFDAHCVHAADIDNDGDMDILGAAASIDAIAWWENEDGSGNSWIEHTVTDSFDGAYCAYSSDIDGDGDMDILGSSRYDDSVVWWENSDTSPGMFITENIIAVNIDFAYAALSADIDGDGRTDVVATSRYSGDVIWWKNINGDGTEWMMHIIDHNFRGASGIHAADMDGDGDVDVLGAAEYDDQVTWWENSSGSGTSWAEHIVDDYCYDTNEVYAEDIDGNGSLDILCTAYSGNAISWWALDSYPETSWLESSILDAGPETVWDSIDWLSVTPTGTTVEFQVRASSNSYNMGEWSVSIPVPSSLTGVLEDGNRYVQYRAILGTVDTDTTACLEEVTISWDHSEINVTEYLLMGAEPNPAHSQVNIAFAVPVMSTVELMIYDLSGHLTFSTTNEDCSPGIHRSYLCTLSPGVYFCRMRAVDFDAARRFVVIR